MTIGKSECGGLDTNLILQHSYSFARVGRDLWRAQSAVIPVCVTVESQADSALVHLANRFPRKGLPKVGKFRVGRFWLIETFDGFAGYQAATKKEI